MPRFTALLITLALAATACGGGGGGLSTPELDAFREQPTACGADRPGRPAEMEFDAPGDAGVTGPVTAILRTSCGDITLRLDPSLAPQAVNSFVFLAEEGYFDNTVSHRVVPGFVIQAGDPTATGRGGPGYRLQDELPPAGFQYVAGTVAMANAGPNSAGSQFFLTLGDVGLDPTFTVFGTVVDGVDVMQRIASLPMGSNPGDFQPSRPLETVYLEDVEIVR
jgi:cyclophilin family peptidyl-prolyl cis-trans isomerase